MGKQRNVQPWSLSIKILHDWTCKNICKKVKIIVFISIILTLNSRFFCSLQPSLSHTDLSYFGMSCLISCQKQCYWYLIYNWFKWNELKLLLCRRKFSWCCTFVELEWYELKLVQSVISASVSISFFLE